MHACTYVYMQLCMYTCNGCNTGKSALSDMYAQARARVLQLTCDTSGKASAFIC